MAVSLKEETAGVAADGADAAVAEVVDVVDLALAVLEVDQLLDHRGGRFDDFTRRNFADQLGREYMYFVHGIK